jgi:cytochrome b6-f complex iron-sulfur subunit
MMSIDTDRPVITAQQYEILHGGGAEAAEIARQRLSRRRFLRRSMLAIWGVSATAAVAGALDMLYPKLSGDFGSTQIVGKKSDFKAATPDKFQIDQAGVYHRPVARTYVTHMAADTQFLLHGNDLAEQLQSEFIIKDSDGSYWLALYQKCVHLGCTVPFKDSCASFKCPCHGSHYNVSGEYLDGPAARSLDRFQISFQGDNVVVNTGVLNQTVAQPDETTRLIAPPSVECTV